MKFSLALFILAIFLIAESQAQWDLDEGKIRRDHPLFSPRIPGPPPPFNRSPQGPPPPFNRGMPSPFNRGMPSPFSAAPPKRTPPFDNNTWGAGK